MPNGDLITADYEFQLHNTLYGRGNNGVYVDGLKSGSAGGPIQGLGVPDAKTQDVDYAHQDGSYANPDFLTPRLITISCFVKGASETAAMTSLKALSLAWVPQTADTDLAFRLPGWGVFYVNGRPRGAKFDITHERKGVIQVLLRFDCPNPAITYT